MTEAAIQSFFGKFYRTVKAARTRTTCRHGPFRGVVEIGTSATSARVATEVTEAAIQAFFGKFYRTVKAARKTTTSSAVVTFRVPERDRALLEMQGRELMGHSLQCHKDRETDLLEAPVKKTLRDDEIHAMLVEREAARSRRDYPGDARRRPAQAGGRAARAGRAIGAADGRTGHPAARARGGGGGGAGARGPRVPPTADLARGAPLLVELGGDRRAWGIDAGKIRRAPQRRLGDRRPRRLRARAFADADAGSRRARASPARRRRGGASSALEPPVDARRRACRHGSPAAPAGRFELARGWRAYFCNARWGRRTRSRAAGQGLAYGDQRRGRRSRRRPAPAEAARGRRRRGGGRRARWYYGDGPHARGRTLRSGGVPERGNVLGGCGPRRR